ncbi:cell division protein FtsK [Tetzosporium hominis]|uniref:Cell division protein FtsK n=1 Tax=Tetzosporium hominis TaxID=2020506 RepID=A0A264W6W0_9BACL|nr:DNA translocase FtsK [Tetzosporium hominis]OZS79299.1 cell division protein FtsK [Tetzosporium hominis]
MARKQTKRKPTKKKKTKTLHPLLFEIFGLILIGLAIIALFQYGPVGRGLHAIGTTLFGNWHAALPFFFILYALWMMIKQAFPKWTNRITSGAILSFAGILMVSHHLMFTQRQEIGFDVSPSVMKETWNVLFSETTTSNEGGGLIGGLLYAASRALLAANGALILAWILISIGIILITGKALLPWLAKQSSALGASGVETFKNWKNQPPAAKPAKTRRSTKVEKQTEVEMLSPTYEEESVTTVLEEVPTQEPPQAPIISAFNERPKPEKVEPPEKEVEINLAGQELENEAYILPSFELLTPSPHADQSSELGAIQTNAKKLEQTFLSFGVKAKVTQVHLGPAVTKYEVLPDVGVKVSRIVSLSDDLALALAARDIRIEAPIPGKSAIGIEVPNSEVAMVSLREVLEEGSMGNPGKLAVALGRDITGKAVVAELNKMPHLLVAGSTGSGKSVCMNGIIVSLMMRAKPHEVKMMMIDPKMVELNVYNGIPHLLAPVVTDPRKASQALKKIVSEMERRYDLFSHTGTRNMEGYNHFVDKWNSENEEQHAKLPYIVVFVDELADLMMVASNDVEDSITRLAQMARASGIHLIIATQRPSVDVITGIIKANIPSRIAFSVSSAIDSRTILDMGGAEKLLGRGDMLFHPSGNSKPVRVQGAFVSDAEVERVVDAVVEQQKANYVEEMIPSEVEETVHQEERDDLFDDAANLVMEMQTASVSMIQRRFRVGYSRAARIIDQLELAGIVGPYEGSKPRQVLMNRGTYDTEEV